MNAKLFLVPIFLVIWFQMYSYALGRRGTERQTTCRSLGICSFSLGVVSLLTRDPLLVATGLVLMMFGFRLIAHGLDRLDKKVFIDNYQSSDHD